MQLLINNSLIPLNPGTSLPLVWRSPLFATSESKIPGTYIYNTSLPGSEVLRQEFGQAHRVQRGGKAAAELPFTITDGSLRYSGTVALTEATRDSYDAAFKIDNGDLAGKLKLKTLKDLDWGADIDIISIFSHAYNTDVITYNSAQASPQIIIDIPLFDTVIVDITNSLNVFANSFTAPENGDYSFSTELNVTLVYGYVNLVIKKNGAADENLILSDGNNLFSKTYTLAAGDVITFIIHVESQQVGVEEFETLSFDIANGAFVSFSKGENVLNASVELTQDESDFVVFPIYNPKLLENFPDDAFQLDNLSVKTIYSEHFPVLNYWKNGEFPIMLSGSANGEMFHVSNLFTPFVYMRSIVLKIADEAGYTIVNNPFDTDSFEGMVLFNAYAENTFSTNVTTLLPIKPKFNLADHVPAILQSDFINYITWLTGYVPVVDNNLLTITFVDIKDKHIVSPTNATAAFPGKILNNPLVKIEPEYKGIKFELQKASVDSYLSGAIKDLHDKLIYKGSVTSINLLPASGNMVNDMYLVTNLNEYYVFQYNPDTYTLTWSFYSKKFPILYTEGIEPYLTINTELCPVLTTRIEDETLGAPSNRIWTVPRCDQAGTLEGFPDSLGAEYGLQVLYYKGMGTDSLGASYPLGSSRYSDYPGTPDAFPDLSASSLFDTRYKNWMQWLAYSAKPATLKVILTAGELARIKAHQIYSAYGYNFMVKEIRINLMVDGLSLAEMEIYTV
jgi:hypothetical protein